MIYHLWFRTVVLSFMHADDTLLYYSGNPISLIETCLTEDLNRIVNWLDNYLFLYYVKSKVMLMGTHQRLAKVNSFTIKARDTILSREYKFKYLGVMLDPCLTWNYHIDYISPPKFCLGWACLTEDLNRIVNWLDNYLFLYYVKSKVMLMGTHQRLAKVNSFTIKARDTILSREYKFKYLGVMLDPCLTWNYHIDYISPPKFCLGWACCGRLGKSFLGGHVSHCMSP